MQAVGYDAPGGSDVFHTFETTQPDPGERELLVRVRAVSVNPVDVKLRASSAPKEGETRILGFDGAGIVEAAGRGVTLFRPGDRIFHVGTIGRAGTNAAYHVVDERLAGGMPKTLSFEQAAALPLTTVTAWELLFDRLRVPYGAKTQGGTLLVINGAGGVGSILVQLAARLTGLTVIATASRPETIAWVRSMGAHHVIDHHQPLDEAVRALGIRTVDYVAGLTGTDVHLKAIAKIIAPQGSLALIDDPKSFDIVPLRSKAVTISWEGMFVRALFGTDDMIAQHRLLNEVAALIDAGVLRTTLHDDFGPLTPENLARAHDHVASGKAIGKTVLSGIPV